MLLAILYLPVWFIFVRASPIQTRALAAALSQTYRLQGHRLEVDSTQTDLEFRLFARPGLEGEISTRAVASNTVFLLALLLASPGMNWRNRLTRTALGLVLLFLTQLFFLLTKVEITLIAAQHPLAGSAFFWKSADNFLEITGKVFFPILIWLALALPYMTGSAVDQRGTASPPAKVGRNAPCPCGSGKKYKHCCGQ